MSRRNFVASASASCLILFNFVPKIGGPWDSRAYVDAENAAAQEVYQSLGLHVTNYKLMEVMFGSDFGEDFPDHARQWQRGSGSSIGSIVNSSRDYPPASSAASRLDSTSHFLADLDWFGARRPSPSYAHRASMTHERSETRENFIRGFSSSAQRIATGSRIDAGTTDTSPPTALGAGPQIQPANWKMRSSPDISSANYAMR